MTLRCWRPPRSGWSWASRCALMVIPTARFSTSALSAIAAAAADGDLDGRLVAGAHLDAALQVEDDPRVGRLLEVELLDLDVAVARGRLPVDPVERVTGCPRPDGRRQRRGLERPLAHRVAAVEVRRRQAPQRDGLQPRVDGDVDARCRRDADDSKKPNGSPVRICSGSIRKWPRLVSGVRMSHERSVRPPSEMARPGRPAGSEVGLWISSQGFGMRLVFRSVYVTRMRSPTWPDSWLTAYPASRSARPRRVSTYDPPTTSTPR